TQRQCPPVPGCPVLRGQRQRQPRHPPVEKRLEVAWPEPVADQLQAVGVITAGEPVGQLGEADPGPGGRLLGMLMTVEPDLDRIREVRADLDEPGPPELVPDVE